jgi:hypothetical protein
MFGALIRAAESWRGLRFSEFEFRTFPANPPLDPVLVTMDRRKDINASAAGIDADGADAKSSFSSGPDVDALKRSATIVRLLGAGIG